jgi:hypothetical protein
MSADQCVSCGMPMRSAEDHALGDTARPYCRHCAAPDGSLKSYEEVLGGLTAFLLRTQGLDDAVARAAARSMLSTQPAWSKR